MGFVKYQRALLGFYGIPKKNQWVIVEFDKQTYWNMWPQTPDAPRAINRNETRTARQHFWRASDDLARKWLREKIVGGPGATLQALHPSPWLRRGPEDKRLRHGIGHRHSPHQGSPQRLSAKGAVMNRLGGRSPWRRFVPVGVCNHRNSGIPDTLQSQATAAVGVTLTVLMHTICSASVPMVRHSRLFR